MEIILCVIIVIIATALAAYFFADSRAAKRFIQRQNEWLEVERKEKLEWAGKALNTRGKTPLFHTPEKKEDTTPARRVVTRAEAAARPHTQDTIDKAKEILKA